MPRGAKATGPRITHRPWLVAAFTPIALALAAFAVAPANAHASLSAVKLPQKLPPKLHTPLPAGVVLAQVPWKRLASHPVKEFVPLATLPWKRYFTHPVPEFVPLATLPWANCHVVHLALPHAPQRWGVPDCHFIMAMCRDQQGNLWLATEGSGIYRCTPSAPKGQRWTQFTKQNTHGALANNCIYAIACDNHNRIWAGELNHGISVFNGKTWQDYDIVQNPKHHVLAGPLGDHVFAMKFDRYTDQMWIGTNAGISVYRCGRTLRAKSKTASRAARNGVRSRSQTSRAVYPLGMNAITLSSAIDPSARRVADRGRPHARHHWHYITQANGLPMNPDAIAFGSGGTVYVGTQCGGLAVGTLRQAARAQIGLGWGAYHWTVIKGPWHIPLTATGKGLPSNLINAVAVESGGRVVVGTDGGIAFGPSTTDATPAALAVPSPASLLAAPRRAANNLRHSMQRARRSASHWTFEHGRNFVAKVYGLWHPPAHWTPPSGQTLEQLPTEDHTTVVAWQPNPANGPKAGYLWLGHWRTGLDVWQYGAQGKIIQRWHIHEPQVGNYVESLQPLKGGAMAVGCYGKGAFIITLPGQSKNAWRTAPGQAAGRTVPEMAWRASRIVPAARTNFTSAERTERVRMPEDMRFPAAAATPTTAKMRRLLTVLCAIHRVPRRLTVAPIADDWRTRGDWIDAVGRDCCVLGAMMDQIDGSGGVMATATHRTNDMYNAFFINNHWHPTDQIRRWVSARQTTDPRALENNIAGGRTMSSWDDHGEAYPQALNGPNMYFALAIRPGRYVLSLYFVNDDSQAGANAQRDYAVELRSVQLGPKRFMEMREHQSTAVKAFDHGQVLCRSRVSNFYGGVYKRFFLLVPPGTRRQYLIVRVDRNYSQNAIMSGIFLDSYRRLPKDVGFGVLVHPRWAFQSYPRWKLHHIPPREFAKRAAWILQAFRAQPASKASPNLPQFARSVARSFFNDTLPRHPLTPAAQRCFDLFEQLMYLRRANPAWYALHGQNAVLAVLRFVFQCRGGRMPIASQLSWRQSALFSRRFVASFMRNIGLCAQSLHVCINRHNFALFQYDWICKHGPETQLPAGAEDFGKSSLFDRWIFRQRQKECLQ